MAIVGAFVVTALAVPIWGPPAFTQRRDAAPPVAEAGTAMIAGVVTAVRGTAPPQPARRAIVTLTGAGLPTGRSAITDDEGRFVLDQLPAGRFMLTASKPAYLPASYGAKRPGRAGVPIALADGTRILDVSLTLVHGAAIEGTVRNAAGMPVLGAAVAAFRLLPDGMLSPAVTTTSDDRGTYRIFGLTAGTYVVSATVPAAAARTDILELTSEAIDRKLEALRIGRARAGQPPPRPLEAPSRSTLAPVFHPQAYSAVDASRIAVGFGEDRLGIDITLDRVRAAVVSGIISGEAAGSATMVTLTLPDGAPQPPSGASRVLHLPAGTRTFQFTNVVPGRYVLTARTPQGTQPMSWARSAVEVAASDLEAITLTLRPGLRLTGRIVFEGTQLRAPADLTAIRVLLDEAMPRPVGAAGGGRGTAASSKPTTDAQGNFVLDDVMSGTYRVSTSFASDAAGWWLRSAVINGQDVMDMPLRVEPDTPLTGAVLTFSDRHTELSGTLEVPPPDRASDYTIVVFPEDRARWLPRARRIQSVRPGTDGTYLFRNLPPGRYRLGALTDVGPDDLLDAAVLDALAAASIRVTLDDGERKTQSLRVGGF